MTARVLQFPERDLFLRGVRAFAGFKQTGVDDAGGAVGVWTVDDETAVAWCKLCRPDSIFTNRPVEIGPSFKP